MVVPLLQHADPARGVCGFGRGSAETQMSGSVTWEDEPGCKNAIATSWLEDMTRDSMKENLHRFMLDLVKRQSMGQV